MPDLWNKADLEGNIKDGKKVMDKFLKQSNLKYYSRRAHRASLELGMFCHRGGLGSIVLTIAPVVLTLGHTTYPLRWDAATLVQWSESSVPRW